MMNKSEIRIEAINQLSIKHKIMHIIATFALFIGVFGVGLAAMSILAHDKAINNQAPAVPAEVATQLWLYGGLGGIALLAMGAALRPNQQIDKLSREIEEKQERELQQRRSETINKILQTIPKDFFDKIGK